MKLYGWLLSFVFAGISMSAQAATLEVGEASIRFLPDNNTYALGVNFRPNQFQSIYNSGRKIELRYYSVERNFNQELEKHSVRRLQKDETIYVQNSRSASYNHTFRKDEICPEKGHYVGKVWLDVRMADGKNDADYDKNEYQGSYAKSFAYTCYDDRAPEIDFDPAQGPEFNVANNGSQLNFKAWLDKQTFDTVMGRGGESRFDITFYAFHEGQRIKLFENKSPYKVKQQKMAYTLSAKELCGKVMDWWDSSVDVKVGLELSAIHSDGNESWSFKPFVTRSRDRFEVKCVR